MRRWSQRGRTQYRGVRMPLMMMMMTMMTMMMMMIGWFGFRLILCGRLVDVQGGARLSLMDYRRKLLLLSLFIYLLSYNH